MWCNYVTWVSPISRNWLESQIKWVQFPWCKMTWECVARCLIIYISSREMRFEIFSKIDWECFTLKACAREKQILWRKWVAQVRNIRVAVKEGDKLSVKQYWNKEIPTCITWIFQDYRRVTVIWLLRSQNFNNYKQHYCTFIILEF